MDNGDDEVVEMDTFSVNSGYQVVGERRQSHNPHRGHSSVPATFSSSNDATVQALGMPTDFVEPTWSETFDAWRDLIMGCLGRSREGDEEIEELEGEYLPENQQEPIEPNKTGAGVLSSSINLIKATIGAGILALPYSISRMGYILGPCMLVFSGLVSVFTLTLVVKSCYVVIERWKERGIKVFPPLSFHSVMKEAVPSRIPIIAVDIILCLTLFGVLCSYLIIMGKANYTKFDAVDLS
ncbi:hypothetical protein Pelo_10804 [Pelomyxa schiedti]|nr:hypothetical protein Pelo_10804 [Pelomyxa schiedti]